jgi:hypothetical protein
MKKPQIRRADCVWGTAHKAGMGIGRQEGEESKENPGCVQEQKTRKGLWSNKAKSGKVREAGRGCPKRVKVWNMGTIPIAN